MSLRDTVNGRNPLSIIAQRELCNGVTPCQHSTFFQKNRKKILEILGLMTAAKLILHKKKHLEPEKKHLPWPMQGDVHHIPFASPSSGRERLSFGSLCEQRHS